MNTGEQRHLLEILKTLADESRLALLQLTHEREQMVGELAERMGLSESTVSHHLSRLHSAGLVSLRMDGNKRFYRSSENGLAIFKRLAADIEKMPVQSEPADSDDGWIAALGWSAEDEEILRSHTHNQQLTRLPVKHQKKLNVILRWLSTLFQPDRLYSEPEINAILRRVYEMDFVSLRRDLVDFGYLRRERGGGQYWLAPLEEKIAQS